MRVVLILGIICDHLEALRQVVKSTTEVGFPSGLVIGELVDFPTRHCPGLWTHIHSIRHSAGILLTL